MSLDLQPPQLLQPPRFRAEARAHEQRLAEAVLGVLPPASDHPVDGVHGQYVVFEDVAIEGTFPHSVLAVYVRHPARPACRFAVGWPLWNVAERAHRPDGMIQAGLPFPAERAGPILAQTTERFVTVGLTAECTEGEVTWVSKSSRVLDPDYWAARVLEAARRHYPVGTYFRGQSQRCRVSQLYVDGQYPDQRLVVLIHDDARPQCRFGCRWQLWDDDGRPDVDEDHTTPEEDGHALAIALQENLEATDHGLPANCTPEEITCARLRRSPGRCYACWWLRSRTQKGPDGAEQTADGIYRLCLI